MMAFRIVAIFSIWILLHSPVSAEDDGGRAAFEKLLFETFEDSSILSPKDVAELKSRHSSLVGYFRTLRKVYARKRSAIEDKVFATLDVLIKRFDPVFTRFFAALSWRMFDKGALDKYIVFIGRHGDASISYDKIYLYSYPDKDWKNYFGKIIREKSEMVEIASGIKPADDAEKILLGLVLDDCCIDYLCDLPVESEFAHGIPCDEEMFIEKPEEVRGCRILPGGSVQLSSGHYIYWDSEYYLFITLSDDKGGRIQFRVSRDSGEDIVYTRILRRRSARDEIKPIVLVYQFTKEENENIHKVLDPLIKKLSEKAKKISLEEFLKRSEREDREMFEKYDVAESGKPKDAFPMTWEEKRRIEAFLKKVDLSGLKKYVSGKDPNFDYIHEGGSSLTPVMRFTAKDADGGRFTRFLEFFIEHGFNVESTGSHNPLFLAILCANAFAIKSLIEHGADFRGKYKGMNLLEYAEYIVEDKKKYASTLGDNEWKKEAREKIERLNKRVIPYLKGLKDPKTGKPVFEKKDGADGASGAGR